MIDGDNESSPKVKKGTLLRSQVPDSGLNHTFCPICTGERRKFLYEEREWPVWKCLGCGHMYVSPQPSESVLEGYYAEHFMPETDDQEAYEWNAYSNYDSTAQAIAEFVPQRGDLLDIGAGFGGFLERAAEDGWRLFGIEPSKAAHRVIEKRLGSKVSIQKAIFMEADLAPSSFDCIAMLNVIEHVRDPTILVKRAFKLLRPGGCLALRWPQCVFMRSLDFAPAHLHGFTGQSMGSLLSKTGFIDSRDYWAGMRQYNHRGFLTSTAAKIFRIIGKTYVSCTFGRYQIPFVSRLTLGRKPPDSS